MTNQKNTSMSLLEFWNKEQKNNKLTFLENIQESLDISIVYMEK